MGPGRQGYFEEYKRHLRPLAPGPILRGTPVPSTRMLRRAQLGAAFAAAAHFTLNREPALISMPTGSGKTGVMTLLPFLLGSLRVLVVTPSKLLREQLAGEFATLNVLRSTGAMAEEAPSPRTHAVTSRLGDGAAWLALAEFDVVVGTPNVLSPGYDGVSPPPSGLFALVLVDEAHHTPARTYDELLRAFDGVPVALFTATPFRRDRHALPGVSVYSYGLGQALEEGVLAPIEFRPVDVAPTATVEERDLALATAAVERVRADVHERAGSRIIARTSTVAHAKGLLDVYARAGVQLGLVTASTSPRRLRKVLAGVRSGDLLGLISVGVLGEGFDFPTLKVGVYHQRHASLPATLQFLGRITRLVPDGPPAELLAIREEVSDETRELYASDVAWASLVPALADAAVEAEAERRRYLRGFDPAPTEPLSLSALRPRKDVQVFRLAHSDALDLHAPVAELGGGEVIYQGVDRSHRLAVVITEHLDRPDWLDADTLDRFRYELHVLVKEPTGEFVFVRGSRDSTIAELLSAFGCDDPDLVEPMWLDRLMSSVALDDYHSVGMRSARASGGRLAAYRMMAGNKVGNAVLPSETRGYGTGHAIARVRDPMTVTAEMIDSGMSPASAGITSLGVSYGRAKVFSPDLVGLLEFRRWCDRLTELVRAQSGKNPAGLPGLRLLSPRLIAEFPADPYAALIEPSLLGQGFQILDPETGHLVGLEQLEIVPTRATFDELQLVGAIEGIELWKAAVDTAGTVTPRGEDLLVQGPGGRDRLGLTELLTDSPLTVFYPDGASTMGRIMFQPRLDYPEMGTDVLKTWSFAGVDIRAEAKNPRSGLATIKDYAIASFAGEAQHEFIIDDDRAGEVADLVVIGREDEAGMRRVTLVHCKYSHESDPGARVLDLYEVLGQAGRSVAWLDSSRLAARLIQRLATGSRVSYGDSANAIALLADWVTRPAAVAWAVVVVQPGLRISDANSVSNIRIMLNDTLEWVTQHDASFAIIGHQ